MDFASSILQSAASSLAAAAKPTLASHYTAPAPAAHAHGRDQLRPIQIGVWRVTRAQHATSGKLVSIWTADKHSLVQSTPSGAGTTSSTRERDHDRLRRAVDVLKKEAASLSRLRHPCILEMAEPMEESRSSITFATEPVTASLRHAIAASDRAFSASAVAATGTESSSSARNNSSSQYRSRAGQQQDQDLELDEVEIQKGMSQLGKGLQFLHESAKLVHGNLTPEAVIINDKGDWKLSGFGLSQNLYSPEGAPAKWEFATYDPALPPSCQRNYDYIAPEYICDEMPPAPSNDLYSLGCILHAIHTHNGPPFSHRNSLSNVRTNIEEGLSHNLVAAQWRKLSDDVRDVLASLVTRYPNRRLTAKQFLDSRYFEGLLVSTLRFLERDSFAAKSSEAQAGFLKGLGTVLNQFSDKVNRRKVLPSLLEETRKHNLVPFLLPNILHIATKMSPDDFRTDVLPSLKPLFAIKEPPQAVVALLESLPVFELKCAPAVFRDEIMPLIYHSLESDNPVVLEKALRVVPKLCETLDYTTVKQTLFPKITTVFSKTTLLSVKVNTLICFHAMIGVLDKFTLTEKLVPLLSRIKTKEPSVMIATLAVHEEMGKKCEVEAVATLILPQLWTMSIGPLLNADQFAKFMSVIKALGTRVEQEHMKHLAELKRLEESSGAGLGPANSGIGAVVVPSADVTDFESLVRGNVNGHRVGGLAAKGSQVDIFADISPVPSPAPQPSLSNAFVFAGGGSGTTGSGSGSAGYGANGGGASGGGSAFASPPLPSVPTLSPPYASTSTLGFAGGSISTQQQQQQQQPRAMRPTPSTRLSSTRSAPTSHLVSPPPGGSSTTPSPAPAPTASTLRSFAPLQPSGSSSTSSSSRTVTSASLAQSNPAAPPQPNYNLSLSTTSSLGGLPPLQPTNSSLFGNSSTGGGMAASPSSSSRPQQALAPQPAVQWNRVPSTSSLGGGGGATTALLSPLASSSANRPPPPLHSSSSAAGAASSSHQQRAFPPGYSPSSSLVPVSSSSSPGPASQARPHANAGVALNGGSGSGGARTLDFGAWADLDPLK